MIVAFNYFELRRCRRPHRATPSLPRQRRRQRDGNLPSTPPRPPPLALSDDDNDARGYQLCAVAPPIAAVVVVSPLCCPSPSSLSSLPSSSPSSSPLSPSSPSSLLPSRLRHRRAFCCRCIAVTLSIAVVAVVTVAFAVASPSCLLSPLHCRHAVHRRRRRRRCCLRRCVTVVPSVANALPSRCPSLSSPSAVMLSGRGGLARPAAALPPSLP